MRPPEERMKMYEKQRKPTMNAVQGRSAVKRLQRKSKSISFRKFGRAAAGARPTQPRSWNAPASHHEKLLRCKVQGSRFKVRGSGSAFKVFPSWPPPLHGPFFHPPSSILHPRPGALDPLRLIKPKYG